MTPYRNRRAHYLNDGVNNFSLRQVVASNCKFVASYWFKQYIYFSKQFTKVIKHVSNVFRLLVLHLAQSLAKILAKFIVG